MVLAVSLLGVGVAWAVSSPVGASPDDDFHLASIWCSALAPDDLCRASTGEDDAAFGDGQRPVDVPVRIAEADECYAFKQGTSASCQDELGDVGLARTRANDGLYPGGYYHVMGLLVGDDPYRSVVLMRIAAFIVAVAVIVAAAIVAQGSVRQAYVLAMIATSVPMTVYLLASNNPSGWSVAGVSAFWCAASTLLVADSHARRMAAGVVAGAAMLISVSARGDAAVFILLAALAAVASRPWDGWRNRRLLYVGGLAAVAALTLVASSQTAINADGFTEVPFERPAGAMWWYNLTHLPSLWAGSLGTWGLGWLDTPLPDAVPMLMIAVAAGLGALGIVHADGRTARAAIVVAGFLVVAPLVVLAGDRALVGQNVQPRYLLPAIPVLLGTLLMAPQRRRAGLVSRGGLIVIAIAAAVAHSVALHTNIRRYVTGLDVIGFDLNLNVEWWWSWVPPPLLVWFIGSTAFAFVVAVTLEQAILRWEDPSGSHAPAPSLVMHPAQDHATDHQEPDERPHGDRPR